MKNLELNIRTIKRKCDEKDTENIKFRSFLKGFDSDIIDKIAHDLNKEITNAIDCTKCANCCISLDTGVTEEEIEKLCEIDKMDVHIYIKNYLEYDETERKFYFKYTPCKYLNGKKCSIYEDRPEECRSFPHTHKKDLLSRSLSLIINAEYCPIVYNLIERMKQEMGFEY